MAGDPITNGRDPHNGRFTVGNPGGPGNPFAGKVQKCRLAAMEYATAERTANVMAALYERALERDVPAIKEWLQRTCGPGEALDMLAMIQDLENKLREQGFLGAKPGPGAQSGAA